MYSKTRSPVGDCLVYCTEVDINRAISSTLDIYYHQHHQIIKFIKIPKTPTSARTKSIKSLSQPLNRLSSNLQIKIVSTNALKSFNQ